MNLGTSTVPRQAHRLVDHSAPSLRVIETKQVKDSGLKFRVQGEGCTVPTKPPPKLSVMTLQVDRFEMPGGRASSSASGKLGAEGTGGEVPSPPADA